MTLRAVLSQEVDRIMNWAIIASGLGAVAVVTILCVLIAASDTTSHAFNSAWLFVLFPIAMTAAGALLLAGREHE